MRVFITGISGFVGSGLVSYFLREPEIVIFGHSRNPGRVEKSKDSRITMVPDYSARVFDELGIDYVIHLAGIAHDVSNRYTTDDYDKVNCLGTVTAFDCFVKSKATKFIFLSSIKASVDSSDFPVTEEVEPAPLSDYGRSKLKAERYLIQTSLASTKLVYVLRPVLIYGEGIKGNLKALHQYVKSGLPYFFGAYGNHRSLLSAENLHFVVLCFLKNNYASGTYHVSDDDPISTNDLIRIISKSLGRSPRIWKIPKWIIDPLSTGASFIGIPLVRLKKKLTENLVVSNAKLKSVMRESLPVNDQTDLLNTFNSFK